MNSNEVVFTEKFIVVQNDTECDCQCPFQTDYDCKKVNPNFILSDIECGCTCPQKILCSSLHQFDSAKCKCMCNKDKFSKLEATCSSLGLRWNESECK